MKRVSLLMVCLFFVVGMAVVGRAQVSVSVNVPPPPPLAFPAPPDVVVVPSEESDVYLVPNTAGLYFFDGFWYRFFENHWFRSTIYNGPWGFIETPLIPAAVGVIPPDYILGLPPGYHHIHYGEFRGHWRDWGRNHYWNNKPWYRDHALHHWGGREFQHSSTGFHHADVHHGGDLHHGKEAIGAKDTKTKVGSTEKTTGTKTGTKTVTGTKTTTGAKTVTGTKTMSGTKTGTGMKTGTGTKTMSGTKTGTGMKTGTPKTSGGAGHSAVHTGGTGSKVNHK